MNKLEFSQYATVAPSSVPRAEQKNPTKQKIVSEKTQLVLELMSRLGERNLDAFVELFRQMTNHIISPEFYQRQCLQLIPTQHLFVANRLVRALLEENFAVEKAPKYHHVNVDEEEEEDSKDEKESKNNEKKKNRVRKEWSLKEDLEFLNALRENKLDFHAIAKILPNRTRSQIRTHYRYLAKSILANIEHSKTNNGPFRRIRTRGRPPHGRPLPQPTKVSIELQNIIEQLELARHNEGEQANAYISSPAFCNSFRESFIN